MAPVVNQGGCAAGYAFAAAALLEGVMAISSRTTAGPLSQARYFTPPARARGAARVLRATTCRTAPRPPSRRR